MSTLERSPTRPYEQTHPWITFHVDLRKLSAKAWLMLGEADAQCEHIAGVPLAPDVADAFYKIYLSKGIHGTASIEGNTLSEDEVRARLEGDLPLPPSREYLGREIDNIVRGYNRILDELEQGHPMELTPERVAEFNRIILDGLELEDGVVPGEVRTHDVGVLRYKGAPHIDCEFLLQKLCEWLNGFQPEDEAMVFPIAVIKAILAHLYLAWIHPFGDGNGRVARLVEFQLLVQACVPIPAAHLLSDFYNKTRDAYYRELDKTSKRQPYRPETFVEYALQGFVDELRDQLKDIRRFHMQVTWENYVHKLFISEPASAANKRREQLLLDLPQGRTLVLKAKIPELSSRLAVAYAEAGPRTLARDLNALEKLGLIRRTPKGIMADRSVLRAFLPARAKS